MTSQSPRQATLIESLIPVLVMISFLGITILRFGGSPHIPLIGGTIIAALMGIRLGYSWKDIERGIIDGIVIALQACLILLIIGTLIGTWLLGGIVPTMIYYGLELLSPAVFLLATCVICATVSLATGSSWSTAGTVGIALIGVGQGLGVPLPMVAGAIISGSYFGDKMSPLSDTTNLAPAVAGSDIFTHIRHMVYTTGPSLVLALSIYGLLGIRYANKAVSTQGVEQILSGISNNFTISPLLLIPPCLVILMVVLRLPALPALVGGSILGGICALIFQQSQIAEVLNAAQNGYVSQTGLENVDQLLSRGGMESMLSTIALVICALSFGGAMECTGMLGVIANAILKAAKSTGTLVTATVGTCITMNIIAPDQYLSIVIPGRMYRDAFQKRGLQAKNLSRCLEDGGTLSSSLVPWNTGGAYMGATLGVHAFSYLPFAFLNLINPLVSIFYGFTGITMHKIISENDLKQPPHSKTNSTRSNDK